MKKMTIKQLRKVQADFHDVNNRTVYNIQMSDAIVEAVASLARRLSKLERAGKSATGYNYTDWLRSEYENAVTSPDGGVIRVHGLGTPERKQVQETVHSTGGIRLERPVIKQEQYPKREPNSYPFSVDVLLDVGSFSKVTGYYCYQSNPPMWKVYTQNGEEILHKPVKSWQYITDPATTPPTVAPSTWVSVNERLPEIGKRYRNLSNNVLVYVEGHENAERVCIGFYNYSRRAWEVVGRSDIHAVVIKWQLLPGAVE